MNWKNHVVTLSVAGVLALDASAGTVTVPNTFSAGTPARATDVNANFSTLATGINGNAQDISNLQTAVQSLQNVARSAVTVSIGSSAIGGLMGVACQEYEPTTLIYDSGCILAVTSKGFITGVATGAQYISGSVSTTLVQEGTLRVPLFYFTQANCTGTKYVTFTTYSPVVARQGFVLGAIDPSDTTKSYYVKGSSTSITAASVQVPQVNASGVMQSPPCGNFANGTATVVVNGGNVTLLAPSPSSKFFAAQPNDANVTGVPANPAGAVSITMQ